MKWGLAVRTDRLDTKVARRKIRAELSSRRQAAAFAAKMKVNLEEDLDDLVDGLRQPGSAAWSKYSDRLARHLSDSDWDVVELAYEIYDALILVVLEDRTPPSNDDFKVAIERIDVARKRLR